MKGEDGKAREKPMLFDTEKSKKACDVVNKFGYAVQTIFLSEKGLLFIRDNNRKKLELADQETARKYIGENYPKRYIELFGKVEEA